jgi:hypothetical protein
LIIKAGERTRPVFGAARVQFGAAMTGARRAHKVCPVSWVSSAACDEEFFVQGLAFDRLENAKLGLGLLFPIHRGALGDRGVSGDAGEVKARSPQFKETAFGIFRVHKGTNVGDQSTDLRRRPTRVSVEGNYDAESGVRSGCGEPGRDYWA